MELPHATSDDVPSRQALRSFSPALTLFLEEFRLNGPRHCLGNLVLKGKNVPKIAVIPFSPDRTARVALNKLD